ncbi:MAG: hypothetical protein JZU65_20595 [Chlorobium sp.]|nr:hypothetical protein [Chlorobium sp.]
MGTEDNKLVVTICNRNPIELIDLTECLLGVGQQYVRFLSRHPDVAESEDIKLFVKEVRQGSIIADLVPLAPYALPLIQGMNSVISFSTYMKQFGGFLLGKADKPSEVEKTDYEQFNKITSPVAKDTASQFNITCVFKGNVHNNFKFDHVEANAIQNAIARELKALKEPVERSQKKVLMYWYQARNDQKSQAGDKAIIESICQYPLKTVFAFDTLKHEMLFGAENNPFRFAYIVDVVVETVRGKPTMYKIIDFHEKMPMPTSNGDERQLNIFNS